MAQLSKEERVQNLKRGRETAARNRELRAANPVPPGPTLADVMAALSDLSKRIEAVEQRPAAPPDAVPKFVPMQGAVGPERPVTAGEAWAGLAPAPGETLQRAGTQLLEYLTPNQSRALPPMYSVGQRVRLRREAHHGTARMRKVRRVDDGVPAVDDEGRPVFEREFTPLSWGEVLDKIGTLRCGRDLGKGRRCATPYRPNEPCPGCGSAPEVVKLLWQSKNGHWKYKLRVPGLSQQSNGGQDVFEYEIEPA